MVASPERLYDAWLHHLDTWFTAPGAISMRDDLSPLWFATEFDGVRYSHYGRYLILDEPRLIEMTWVTGRNGTDGAETVVRVELAPLGTGAALTLHQRGFYVDRAMNQHREAWPSVLEHLDLSLRSSDAPSKS